MEEAYRRYLAMLGSGVNAMDLETFAVSGTMQLFLEYERRSIIAEKGINAESFGRFRAAYNASGGVDFNEAWKRFSRQRKPRKPRTPRPKKLPPPTQEATPASEPTGPIDVVSENPLRKYRRAKWF